MPQVMERTVPGKPADVSAADLKKDAETIYGALRQVPRPKPPIIKPGEGSSVDSPLDISKMTTAQVRENRDKLWFGAKAP